MDWIFVIGLAIASSIDNVATGLAYGLRGVRIGVASNLAIALICLGFSVAGMMLGQWFESLLPGRVPSLLSAFVLFGLGLRMVYWAVPRQSRQAAPALTIKERLRPAPPAEPANGTTSVGLAETMFLGVALSMNALSNAVGAGLIVLPALEVAAVAAIGSFIAIAGGEMVGRHTRRLRVGSVAVERYTNLLSGLILIGLAATSLAR
jgi:putative sporulation protein YtaF